VYSGEWEETNNSSTKDKRQLFQVNAYKLNNNKKATKQVCKIWKVHVDAQMWCLLIALELMSG